MNRCKAALNAQIGHASLTLLIICTHLNTLSVYVMLLYNIHMYNVIYENIDHRRVCPRDAGKPGIASSIPGGGCLLWLDLGKVYLLTFPARSARCLYNL